MPYQLCIMPNALLKQAACAQKENEKLIDSFFATTAYERRKARELCFQCPVRRECLRLALETAQTNGTWGGLDEGELRRTLSVNALGNYLQRSRFPHCPACRARPSALHIAKGKKTLIECKQCEFTWTSRTSARSVASYWRQRATTQVSRLKKADSK